MKLLSQEQASSCQGLNLTLLSPLIPEQNRSIKRTRDKAFFSTAQANGDNPCKNQQQKFHFYNSCNLQQHKVEQAQLVLTVPVVVTFEVPQVLVVI